MRLSSRFRRGLRWSAASAVTASGLQFLQLLLLARLLDKADFGRFATATLFFQICLQILDTAINNTILHRQENDPRQLSALFWANLTLGLALGSLFWFSAGLIAHWYDEPLLVGVVRLFAVLLPFVGIGTTFKVLLQKQMDFFRIGSIEVSASIASIVIALALALQGLGLQALVWGALVRYGSEALLFLLWKPLLRPRFTFQMQDSQFYLRYGLVQTAERLVTMLTSQVDILLIGKLLGMDALGIYDVIKRLLVRPSNLLHQIVERAALPLYARIQHRRRILTKVFLSLFEAIIKPHFLIYGLLIILADNLLPLFLGYSWLPHVTLFRLMAVYVIIVACLNPIDSLLVAIGKISHWLIANLCLLPLVAIFILLGKSSGLIGIAAFQLVGYLIFLFFIYRLIVKRFLVMKSSKELSILTRLIKVSIPSLLLAIIYKALFDIGIWGDVGIGFICTLIFAKKMGWLKVYW